MKQLSFCNQCAAPLHQRSETEYVCTNNHIIYNNPRTTSGVLILNADNSAVLLATRAIEPRKGKLDTPGGFLTFNEQPEIGARREIKEETGLVLEDLQLIGVYGEQYLPQTSTTSIIYVSHIKLGTPVPSDDVAALTWFDVDKLPSTKEYAWEFMPKMFADLNRHLACYN